MNKLNYAVSGLLSIILLSSAMHAVAQPATLRECQAIEERQARYDCYDRWDAESGVVRPSAPDTGSTAPAPRVQQRDAVPAPQRAEVPAPQKNERSLLGRIFNRSADDETAVATAGTPAESVGKSEHATPMADSDGEFVLIDTVAALDQSAPYVWVITLEGGQTWQQTTSKRYNIEKGDQVRIYPTRWGSNYRLSTENAGGYIQVRRVQ